MRPLRKASVIFKETTAGSIEETGEGYRFAYDRFSQGYSMMVGELPQSRLSADMQDKVRRIMEERHQRIFGG